jgi:hypothetical protein
MIDGRITPIWGAATKTRFLLFTQPPSANRKLQKDFIAE